MSNLQKIISEKEKYDEASQRIIESWKELDNELGVLEKLRDNDGWKLIADKIQKELKLVIGELLTGEFGQSDVPSIARKQGRASALIQILKVADVKKTRDTLDAEISEYVKSL